MAYDLTDDFRRPVTLALAALAIVGWLLVSYFWSQAADVRVQMDDALRRAEPAREGIAADLQNLQKAAGDRRRPEEAGEGRAKGAGGRGLGPRLGAKRARRPHQADQRGQARRFRRAGGGQRQDPRSSGRRRQAEGRNRSVEHGRGPDRRGPGAIDRPAAAHRQLLAQSGGPRGQGASRAAEASTTALKAQEEAKPK